MGTWLVSGTGFLSVFCLVCAAWMIIGELRDPARRRLLAHVLPGAHQGAANQPARWSTTVATAAQRSVEAVRRTLLLNPYQRAPGFRRVRHKLGLLGLVVVGAISAAWALWFWAARWSSSTAWPWAAALIGAWAGAWIVVRCWAKWHARRWTEELYHGLIDVLDLWVLCLDAGMSFQAALARVAQDQRLAAPALREELQLTNQEILAGCPREQALRNLSRRCGSSIELRALVSHIVQSEKLGSSLARTLRVYASTLRFNRHQDMKERIQQLPVKLAFPLVFLILPCLFVVILGPAMLRIYQVLGNR